MDLRARHLFTLSSLKRMGAHKSEFIERFVRNLKSAEFKILGRGEGREFADHLVDSILLVLQGRIDKVKITDSYDKVCEKCPQKGNGCCHVIGKDWPEDLLSRVDQAVVKNTNGLLEIGKEYPPSFLVDNIRVIRSALRKTALELPGILREKKKSP